MRDWVFWLGFWFGVGLIVFVFFIIPLVAYLGFTRRLKFLPSMEQLLDEFPNSLDDLDKRPPYNKLDTSTAMSVLYLELIVSRYLVKLVKLFKGERKRGE